MEYYYAVLLSNDNLRLNLCKLYGNFKIYFTHFDLHFILKCAFLRVNHIMYVKSGIVQILIY